MSKGKKTIFALGILLVFGLGVLTGYLTYKPVRDIYHGTLLKIHDMKNRGRDFKETGISLKTAFENQHEEDIISFVNGFESKGFDPQSDMDIKQVYGFKDCEYLVNYPEGYSMKLPLGSVYDLSHSSLFLKASGGGFEFTITREYSPYDEIDEYFDYYLNRFNLNENFRRENRLTLLEEADVILGEYDVNLISVRLEECPQDYKNVYTYALIKTGGRTFYRIMFKYQDYDSNIEAVKEYIASFKAGKSYGQSKMLRGQSQPDMPQFWSETTKNVYEGIVSHDGKVKWGFYTGKMDTYGIDEKVPQIEREIDYEFDLLMIYFDIGNPPPIEFMKKAAGMGKMVELTCHVTANANTDVYSYTPMLDIYRGLKDNEIRMAARALKEIEMPFIMRLNNEMNSDWTNYSGVVNLSDPQIYIDVWRRIYSIFEQEGVRNAIWTFNPNDRNYPPCNWNNYIAYFPGEQYVQMIGVTGYNTGNYYSAVFGEEWRSFKEIYDHVYSEYSRYFESYPWIITEFATSSHGGDKPGWIREMFTYIDDYENIKMAVWYSNPDMDFREEYRGKIARPYMLDETRESLEAFRDGLKEYLQR